MNTDSLRFFEIKPPTTLKEKVALTERRARLMKIHFDRFTLPRLGELDLFCELGEVSLERIVSDDGLCKEMFSTRGIFGTDSNLLYVPVGKRVVLNFWGLDRSGSWLIGKGDFVKLERVTNAMPYLRPNLYTPMPITYQESNVEEVVRRWDLQPWKRLGAVVQKWFERAQGHFSIASDLKEIVVTENALVNTAMLQAQ